MCVKDLMHCLYTRGIESTREVRLDPQHGVGGGGERKVMRTSKSSPSRQLARRVLFSGLDESKVDSPASMSSRGHCWSSELLMRFRAGRLGVASGGGGLHRAWLSCIPPTR